MVSFSSIVMVSDHGEHSGPDIPGSTYVTGARQSEESSEKCISRMEYIFASIIQINVFHRFLLALQHL